MATSTLSSKVGIPTESLDYDLDRNHVTILVRNTSAIEPHANLTVVEGSVMSEADMSSAFTAAGTLFLGPPRLLADSTALAARELRKQHDQRPELPKPLLVVMNALGAGGTRDVAGFLLRYFIDYRNVGYTYEDHHAVDAEIEGNCGDGVLWIIALAVGLGNAGVKPVKIFGATETGASM